VGSITGITFVEGADGDATMIIEGLESDLNTALNGLVFNPVSDFNGSDTLNIDLSIGADLDGFQVSLVNRQI